MFTVLAGLLARSPVVVAVGMLPLAYGDGPGAVIGLVVMIVEGVAPKGPDNLAIPLSAVALLLLFGAL